jgi:hypothetical protein
MRPPAKIKPWLNPSQLTDWVCAACADAPELNPVESLWKHIRQNYFGQSALDSLQEVEERLCRPFARVTPALLHCMLQGVRCPTKECGSTEKPKHNQARAYPNGFGPPCVISADLKKHGQPRAREDRHHEQGIDNRA